MKTVAFWRRVISSMRGCDQFPGLSVTGAGEGLDGVVLEGVKADALVPRGVSAVDDMLAIPNVRSNLDAKMLGGASAGGLVEQCFARPTRLGPLLG